MLTPAQIAAWRQCPKRLWLDARTPPDLGADRGAPSVRKSARSLARRTLTHPLAKTVEIEDLDPGAARVQTEAALSQGATLFRAALGDEHLLARADIARPGPAGWDLITVRESGSVKPQDIADAAVRLAASHRSSLEPQRVIIAHLDTRWTYPGDEDYRGLFIESDITEAATEAAVRVADWIAGARTTLAAEIRPERGTGPHCHEPRACPHHEICLAQEAQPERPLAWLPGPLNKAIRALQDGGALSMDEIPDAVLNPLQLKVKTQTRLGEPWFDQAGAAAALAGCGFPIRFLDFETVNPAVPFWAGTRPFSQIPFQFSLHQLEAEGRLEHREFLLATGEDPSRAFAEALLASAGESGSVVVYNVGFEKTRIRELAARFEDLAPALNALADRLFDLQPIARAFYYHPGQKGSWSIKRVLPCLAPEIRYDQLTGVQNGTMAIDACLEMMHAECPPDRRAELTDQLRRYCRLDTLAMVAIWARFKGDDALLERVIQDASTPV